MNSEEDDDIINPEKLPIYLKGKEILDVVFQITALISDNDEYLNEVKACMLNDAALLTVKVAGAEAAGLYDLKMENAAIIRKAARDLMAHSIKTPMMTYPFMALKKILKHETQLISHVQYFNKNGHVVKTCPFYVEHTQNVNSFYYFYVSLKLLHKIWKLSLIMICSLLLILLNIQIVTSFLQAEREQEKLPFFMT